MITIACYTNFFRLYNLKFQMIINLARFIQIIIYFAIHAEFHNVILFLILGFIYNIGDFRIVNYVIIQAAIFL